MKQPQLGEKIIELRLAKGLTQTELAEKCKISLRTIQRIESKEVMPRSYTLKLIFNVLEFEGYNVSKEITSFELESIVRIKSNLIKTVTLVIITSIVSILTFKLISNNHKSSLKEITEIIQKNQSDIKRWMNNKHVDSVLTMYDDNACILNSICGKIQIQNMMSNIVNNEYELLEYHTMSINFNEAIAVEKYRSTYKYKGKLRNQVGITEWKFKNGKWSIINDVFRD